MAGSHCSSNPPLDPGNPWVSIPAWVTHSSSSGAWGLLRPPEDHATHPGLRLMQQQLPIYAIQACFFPSPRFFSTSLSVDLASSYLKVPTSMQSSRCCQDFSLIHALTFTIFSLVQGLTLAYSLWLRTPLRCSDGWARNSSALSSGMCGETHPVCWGQLLSPCTFRLHTTTRTGRSNSGCATWSSGWICLTSRCSEVWWMRFSLVLVASWCLLLHRHLKNAKKRPSFC